MPVINDKLINMLLCKANKWQMTFTAAEAFIILME